MNRIEEIKSRLAALLPQGAWRFVEGEEDDDFDEPRVILDEPSLNRQGAETPIATVSNGTGPFIAAAPADIAWLVERLEEALAQNVADATEIVRLRGEVGAALALFDGMMATTLAYTMLEEVAGSSAPVPGSRGQGSANA